MTAGAASAANAATIRPGDLGDLFAAISGDTATVLGGRPLLMVDATIGVPPPGWTPGSIPVVVVGVVSGTAVEAALVDPSPYDVLVTEDDPMLAAIVEQVARCPVAAVSLAVLLRGGDRRSVEEGLAAESAVYSTLQAGAEFAAWRAARGPTSLPPDPEPPVLTSRQGDELHVVLNRPRRHNAVTMGLRDGLAEALTLAAADDSITAVHLSGNGPSFCSGGDLGEFGLYPDPATAHVTRLDPQPGAARPRHRRSSCTCTCMARAWGRGSRCPRSPITSIAAPGTVISLPELGLGLVPGAGGTASIPRRIGRQRTAALALSGAPHRRRHGAVVGTDRRGRVKP